MGEPTPPTPSPPEPGQPPPSPAPSPPSPKPPEPGPGGPTPPAPGPPAPPEPSGTGKPPSPLEAALAAERARAKRAEDALAKAQRAAMSEQERAVAEARDAGKAEGIKAGGLRVALAEFRAACAARHIDPGKLAEHIDFSAFVNDAGEVDSKGIGDLVEGMPAPAAGTPGNGRIPAGPQGGPASGDDWVGGLVRRR